MEKCITGRCDHSHSAIQLYYREKCNQFSNENTAIEKANTGTAKQSILKVDKEFINLIASTITDLADESGWAFLGEVGNLILKKRRDFDPRNYGFAKLTPLIKSIGKFEIEV